MIEHKESKTHDIPVWLTGLILILCIGGGSYLLWWSTREPVKQVADIPPDKLTAIAAGGRGWNGALGGGTRNGSGRNTDSLQGNRIPRMDPDADGIQQRGRNNYRVKIGNTVMSVNYSNNGRFDISPSYLVFRTPEQAELGVLRMSVIQDSTWRSTLNVTDEQVEKLRKIPPALSMKLDPVDRARLTELWKTWKDGSGDKMAAEKALLSALDELGQKNLQATKDYEASRAQRVLEILTPEQVKQYRDGGRSGGGIKPAAAIEERMRTRRLSEVAGK